MGRREVSVVPRCINYILVSFSVKIIQPHATGAVGRRKFQERLLCKLSVTLIHIGSNTFAILSEESEYVRFAIFIDISNQSRDWTGWPFNMCLLKVEPTIFSTALKEAIISG